MPTINESIGQAPNGEERKFQLLMAAFPGLGQFIFLPRTKTTYDKSIENKVGVYNETLTLHTLNANIPADCKAVLVHMHNYFATQANSTYSALFDSAIADPANGIYNSSLVLYCPCHANTGSWGCGIIPVTGGTIAYRSNGVGNTHSYISFIGYWT